MAYKNPHLFDPQSGVDLGSGDPPTSGWTGKFLTAGSSWTRTQNSPYWASNVWVRRHVIVDSGTDRDRSYAAYNSYGNGMDNGDMSGPGDTLWEYFEMAFPPNFPWAGGSWNNLHDYHHGHGQFGNVGGVPFHINTSNARGTRDLTCAVRGGLQASYTSGAPTYPNNEDFLLDSPIQYDHVYRIMVRRTLAPNGTPPQRNQFIGVNQPGAQIVPLNIGDSYGIVEIWVDDVLKVSKRRPTSYHLGTMYHREGLDRNSSGSFGSATFYMTKHAVGNTREELFDTILPVTADTFADGGDSSSSGGGGGTPGPDTLPPLTGGKVRYGVFAPGGGPPGSRIDLSANKIRATGPTDVVSDTEIDKAYVYIESVATGTQVFKLVVWDDDGTSGEPSTRVILSSEISKSCPFDPTWEEITISPAVELTAGNYWMGVHSGATNALITYAYDNITNSSRSADDTYADGSPTTYPGGASSNAFKMAIVLEGTVTGGGGGGSQDTTKPTVASSEVQVPVFVALQMDEELDSTNDPDADAFVVTIDGVNHQPVSTEVASDTVTLTLAVEIPENVLVLVDYDKTLATNKIIDLAGNEMDSFTDQAVDNSVAAPGYERTTAYARSVDPTKRLVNPTNRIVGRERKVWT